MSRKENGIYIVSDKLTVERYNMEGNIYSIIEELQNIRDMAVDMGMVNEGNLDITTERDDYSDYSEIVITYCFDRVENEKEKAIREKAEAKVKKDAAAKRKATTEAKKLKADAEYTEFLRLKEKFGAI
jgi:hypothetical protein